jgi:hypothetical protein
VFPVRRLKRDNRIIAAINGSDYCSGGSEVDSQTHSFV